MAAQQYMFIPLPGQQVQAVQPMMSQAVPVMVPQQTVTVSILTTLIFSIGMVKRYWSLPWLLVVSSGWYQLIHPFKTKFIHNIYF